MDDRLRAFVERVVGPVKSVADRSWPHGVTRVFRVSTASAAFFVKQHSQRRKYEQEHHAYGAWVPALADAGVLVAQEVGCDPGLRALVLTDLDAEAPDPRDPGVHAAAGRTLGVLHGLPCPDNDPMPVRAAVLARLAGWTAEAAGKVPASVVDRVRAEIGDGAAFEGGRRVPCHRDFSPRNWVVREGRFGLIDFEHAVPDVRWVDFVKLADGAWDAPAVRRAFLTAYGRPWSEVDAARFRALVWLHALSTWIWSVDHGDAAYEAHARTLYGRLVAGFDPLSPHATPALAPRADEPPAG